MRKKSEKKSEETLSNPDSGHEAQPFQFNSPAFNRAKFLTLITIQELTDKGFPTDIETIYVNSGLSISTLLNGLPKWLEWNYIIYARNKGDRKEYRITKKGKYFLSKLRKIVPETTAKWCEERNRWLRMLPTIIEDWSRPALVKLLEPLKYHRPGTSRPSIYQAGGVCWIIRDRSPGGTRRLMLVLCPFPCRRIFIRAISKRKKLLGDWKFDMTMEGLLALFLEFGVDENEARELIEKSQNLPAKKTEPEANYCKHCGGKLIPTTWEGYRAFWCPNCRTLMVGKLEKKG